MDQNSNPNEFPGEPPQQIPAPEPGAQIYGPPPAVAYAPPPPVQPVAPPPANNSRRIWLTVLIVLLVLCCCCVLIGVLGWFYGDMVLCNIDPSFGTCPVQ